jgi:hypothetical protein
MSYNQRGEEEGYLLNGSMLAGLTTVRHYENFTLATKTHART